MATEEKEGFTYVNDYNNDSAIDVLIGPSKSNTKSITLPAPNMKFNAIPINKQKDGWKDTFSVTVKGYNLSVTRTDYKHGWGQPLVLKGITQKIEEGLLIGHWKCLVFMKGKGYWGYHDIYCHTHSSHGVVKRS